MPTTATSTANRTPGGGGSAPTTKATLGLTGLTINAMALIAPGAFLWLTFQMQSLYGAPVAGYAMWFGILAALLLCFATAISYAELSKLFPGAGSSYLYAEQAFLSKTKACRFARVAKFFTGWASHLYYWVYPGCMVGVTAIIGGYLLSQFFPDTFSSTYNSPLFMWLFCVLFAFGVAYIAFRGVTGTTGVNMAINIIQMIVYQQWINLTTNTPRSTIPTGAPTCAKIDGRHYSQRPRTRPPVARAVFLRRQAPHQDLPG